MPVSYSDWDFDTSSKNGNYKGNNLAYVMLCEPINSGDEEK